MSSINSHIFIVVGLRAFVALLVLLCGTYSYVNATNTCDVILSVLLKNSLFAF